MTMEDIFKDEEKMEILIIFLLINAKAGNREREEIF